jgi:hypothetical protein
MSDAATHVTKAELVPGRSCGSCALCCKVFAIPPVDDKPRGIWCKHCKPGRGCGIWETRPQMCADFYCLWLRDARLGPEWKPDTAKFVMVWANELVLNITTDPQNPLAYRREPFFANLRDTAEKFLKTGQNIVIYKGEQKFLLLPDGEHLIGGRDEQLEWRVKILTSAAGRRFELEIKSPEQTAA